MFTFSFGSAFAAAPTNEQKTNLLAAENYALNIAEKNFTTALDDIGDETIDGYVIEEENLTDQTLLTAVKEVYSNKDKYIKNMSESGQMDSISTIISLIKEQSK